MVDRQESRWTTVSAPGGVAGQKGHFRSRVGRSMKSGFADFFGLGDEAAEKSQRWNNRRLRYYKGQVKDEYLVKPDIDEPDAGRGRVIYDPFRVPGSRQMQLKSLRTTPLSSTSTYARSVRGLPHRKSRKDSVFTMTLRGISQLAGSRKKFHAKPYIHSRSYAPASLIGDAAYQEDDLGASYASCMPQDDGFSLVDDVFYDEPPMAAENQLADIPEKAEWDQLRTQPTKSGWGRTEHQRAMAQPPEGLDMPDFGMTRIKDEIVKTIQKEEKRQVGMGFMGRLFKRSFRKDRLSSDIKEQIEDIDDHRPYFTYWVTFVQIVVFIVSLAVYGIAPVGVGETTYSEAIMKPNLAIELTPYKVTDNLWVGPSQADLIHLGAKYSPCMRRDENIVAAIELEREEERGSACCIRDDGSGCAQMVEHRCSKTLSSFFKWNTSNPSPVKHGAFKTGSVCGQDPDHCKTPASVPPFVWDKYDITKWPLCTEPTGSNKTEEHNRHMTCQLSGHPCCHKIQGECMITTRDHCDFIKGYFHEEAYLCSQVNCMKQICGMIPFANDEYPDQFYRLWTSLFLHGGLFHLIITIGFQMLIMRDVEKLTGCVRMAIIFTGSGIAGNLASSIFLPYHVEVGPAGSQFGILSCLVVEVLQSFQMLKRPCLSLLKIGGFILFLFLLGLLPWIDNWAHLSGFLFGFLLAFALLPYVSFGQFDKRRKLIGIILSLGGATLLFVLLIILFYVLPLYNCPGCQYFNCIPFTADFCKNMEIKIDRTSTYSDW